MASTDAAALEQSVGHPGDKWETLKERVQSGGLRTFRAVQEDWLNLMWTLDAYRVAGVAPARMGNPGAPPNRRLGAIYRGKGRWFSELLALLLQNMTALHVAPRQKVQGYSQFHQVNVAWPGRQQDPLVCALTKATGAPAYGNTPSRSSLADFSSRRKELKFAATDLKLRNGSRPLGGVAPVRSAHRLLSVGRATKAGQGRHRKAGRRSIDAPGDVSGCCRAARLA